MARLIDADAKIDFIDMDSTWDPLETCFSERDVVDMLESAPTVEAVPVVRCKDCKWLYDKMDDYCCRSHRGLVRICENSFCSYGEQKEGADNG